MPYIYNAIYQDAFHTIINNYHFVGYYNVPKESNYKCEMEWWWQAGWWSYIVLIVANIPAAILLRVPMYYTWGLTCSLQIVSMTPMLKSYLPSCLSFYLRDLMISIVHHPTIQYFFYTSTLFDWLYESLHPEYAPITYRYGR